MWRSKMKNFEVAKEEINKLKGAKAKLDYIFNDIFDINGIDEPLERIYLLIGTISSFTTYASGTKFYYVKNIHTLFGKPETPLLNPYEYNAMLTSHIGMQIREDVQLNDKVVFSVTRGPTRKESEIINTSNDYYTYKQIGITDSMTVDERANIVKEFPMFFEFKEQITKWLEYRGTLEQKESELQRINDAISELTSRLNELEEKEKKVAPNGIGARLIELEEIQRKAESIKPIEQRILNVQKKAKFFLNIDNIPLDNTDEEEMVYNGNCLFDDIHNSLRYSYDSDILKSFLMALSTNQIIIMFGKPGTGKTTFVSEAARGLGAKCEIISVQNNWTDSSDILGYYSPINKTYESTAFVDALIDANKEWQEKQFNSRLHIICLDEMNLARVEYYFASFLSLLQLEPNRRWIRVLPKHIQRELDEYEKTHSLPNEKQYLEQLKEYADFRLPPNVRFVGTINSDDTTNVLSPKVIDRSFFIEMASNQCSDEQEPRTVDGYFPMSLFNIESAPESEDLDVFNDENNRFLNYAKTMLVMYRDKLVDEYDADDYCDLLITAKILPSLRYTSDFKYNDPDKYPKATQKFEEHKPNRGEAYYYLGG